MERWDWYNAEEWYLLRAVVAEQIANRPKWRSNLKPPRIPSVQTRRVLRRILP
jgi:hypothetical protein